MPVGEEVAVKMQGRPTFRMCCDSSLRSNKCLGLGAFKLGLWATQRLDGKLNVAQQRDFRASKNHPALLAQGFKASGRVG